MKNLWIFHHLQWTAMQIFVSNPFYLLWPQNVAFIWSPAHKWNSCKLGLAVTGLKCFPLIILTQCFPWIQLNPLLNHSVDGPVKWLPDDGISQHLLFTLGRSHISLTLLIPGQCFSGLFCFERQESPVFFKLIPSSVLSRSSILTNNSGGSEKLFFELFSNISLAIFQGEKNYFIK